MNNYSDATAVYRSSARGRVDRSRHRLRVTCMDTWITFDVNLSTVSPTLSRRESLEVQAIVVGSRRTRRPISAHGIELFSISNTELSLRAGSDNSKPSILDTPTVGRVVNSTGHHDRDRAPTVGTARARRRPTDSRRIL